MKKKRSLITPPVGNYSSRKEWEIVCWNEILKSEKLLRAIVTPNERNNLVKRAAALERLSAGESYTEVGKELLLSPQTISAIKKILKETGYKSYRERSKTDRKKKKYSVDYSRKPRHQGAAVRTKYGTVYLPR
ncbi:MAG: hypothetical protein HY432_00475 [Candidatus Liptonbacteria bacterium]|nr:hypothetical protein [Candidatus Liptonbacteria bacterium]